jgi:hypothetical protein
MRLIASIILLPSVALAQAAPPPFTVAGIQPSVHSNLGGGMRGPFFGDGSLPGRSISTDAVSGVNEPGGPSFNAAEKRPLPVLVSDRIDPEPTDN